MNRKLNAAITAGLSLSMVLGSTPVTAIAAQVQQPAAKSATEANDWCVLNVYDEADGQQLLGISVQKGQKKVTEALEGNVPAKPGYKIDYLYTQSGLQFSYDEATNTWSGNEATVNDNMDLYVHFVEKQETPAVKKHTVTYYDEGYEPIGYGEIRAGQFNWDQVKPAAKDGYTFVGYKFTGDTDDHIIDFSKTAMPDADVCLQAVWQKNAEPTPEPTENEHTVTIYENGKVSTVKVKDGEKLSKPADPEAVAGYEFVGWSTSKSEMAQYDFDQPVTGDLTIYAMFNAKKETVENGKAEDSKKQVAADKKDEAKAEKKDAAALPTTGDPISVVTSAASLAGAVAAAVGMYMTKRREH